MLIKIHVGIKTKLVENNKTTQNNENMEAQYIPKLENCLMTVVFVLYLT